jgi:hypothetical protein
MINGFDSPNHTETPNDLFDVLMKDMDLAELKVTLAVIRGTIGYHKDDYVCSLSKLCKVTGMCENSVISGAEKAEQRGTIKRVVTGKKTTTWQVRFTDSAIEIKDSRKKKSTSKNEVGLPQRMR